MAERLWQGAQGREGQDRRAPGRSMRAARSWPSLRAAPCDLALVQLVLRAEAQSGARESPVPHQPPGYGQGAAGLAHGPVCEWARAGGSVGAGAGPRRQLHAVETGTGALATPRPAARFAVVTHAGMSGARRAGPNSAPGAAAGGSRPPPPLPTFAAASPLFLPQGCFSDCGSCCEWVGCRARLCCWCKCVARLPPTRAPWLPEMQATCSGASPAPSAPRRRRLMERGAAPRAACITCSTCAASRAASRAPSARSCARRTESQGAQTAARTLFVLHVPCEWSHRRECHAAAATHHPHLGSYSPRRAACGA